MRREINIAENWERAYDAFQQINFKAWDYDSVKESLVDYLKLYYPEDFNDYIESSEIIVMIELFAYISELLAYRIDLNTHENFLTTAERKESILRLAKYLSYNSSRNIPARGLVKITSVKTNESIIDSKGNNLNNVTIKWNDPNNPNWKEQFILVLNSLLEQKVGTVLPSDRVQVQDILFELYTLKNTPLSSNTLPYSVSVSNRSFPMELVSAELNEFGPLEKRPEKDQKINILYLQDGLGDSSDNTGFFFFTKQGTLRRKELFFDGVLPNQEVTIEEDNINNTDVWLNNIDPETDKVLIGDEAFNQPRKGDWEPVDVGSTQNVLFNTSPNRNKYEIETLDNDKIKLIFGDGNFSNIPSGKFELWYRVSTPNEIENITVIPKNAIQNESTSIPYKGADGRPNRASFTFSLYSPIQNSAPTESLERIREVAPSVYYTQDRMVNGRDYNEFMLKDNTILKIRAINRTFAGDSKYIHWHDPKEYYENVKIFGDDLVVYYRHEEDSFEVLSAELPPLDGGLNVPTVEALIFNHIEPIIRTQEMYNTAVLNGVIPNAFKQHFTTSEVNELSIILNSLIQSAPNTAYLTYNIDLSDQNQNAWTTQLSTEPPTWWIKVESNADLNWTITLKSVDLVFESPEVNFTINNQEQGVITYDTLNTNNDEIVILKSNLGADDEPLESNKRFIIQRGDRVRVGESSGLCNYKSLLVLPRGEGQRLIPADVSLEYLIPEDSYVYFYREDTSSPWKYVPYSATVVAEWSSDTEDLWKREPGVEGINFLWLHRTPRYHLVDPAASNIIDSFIITRGYYQSLRRWLTDEIPNKPNKPSEFQLRGDYGHLLSNKMISDTVILHSGDIKILLGDKAPEELQAFIKVVRSDNRTLSDNRIKNEIVSIVDEFFDINRWNFGQPFFFTELSSKIHNRLGSEINSIVLVPKSPNHAFGSLYQVLAKESEILQGVINTDDVEIVESLSPETLKQRL